MKLRQLKTYTILFNAHGEMNKKISYNIFSKANEYLTQKINTIGFFESKAKINAIIRINLEL